MQGMTGARAIVKKAAILAAAAVLFAGAFGWGVLFHRNRVFPFRLYRWVAWNLDLIGPTRKPIPPRSARARLSDLAYLSTAPIDDEKQDGVVVRVPDEVEEGLNFYKETASHEAILIGADGSEIFSWRFDPGRSKEWVHAELLTQDGAVIGVVKDDSIIRLSVDSELEWRTPIGAHHDLQVRPDGTIWALTRKVAGWPERCGDCSVIEDFVSVLSSDGKLLREYSLLDAVRKSEYAYLLPTYAEYDRYEAYDLLHTNHIEVFDGSQSSQSELFAEGNLLVSFWTINSIAILERETLRILWLWGPTNVRCATPYAVA